MQETGAGKKEKAAKEKKAAANKCKSLHKVSEIFWVPI